jgi:drug/metabolite transporter (DMT)-like permease
MALANISLGISDGSRVGAASALVSALLYSLSVPLSKPLADRMSPIVLAACLYGGSALALGLVLGGLKVCRARRREAALSLRDIGWTALAGLSGGLAAPALFIAGLSKIPAASAGLILNFEAPATLILAWALWREPLGPRIWTAALLMTGAGIALGGSGDGASAWGVMLAGSACLFWAADNVLMQRVADRDPLAAAGFKSLIAAGSACALAALSGRQPPAVSDAIRGIGIGGLCYAASLVLYLLAQRRIGSARTGACFALAPFTASAAAIILLGERPELRFWLAAVVSGGAAWLIASESHEHLHAHPALEHEHRHSHDEHHGHAHAERDRDHSHPHAHGPLEHSHPHGLDVHHRHPH